ncbi:MAG: adenylate/guanylate cyclase domain-containing protein [Anaerolineales bacterium]|nr:adenylate/guanylate cyclase domain-containing protein [Anaerolineales bacterium]
MPIFPILSRPPTGLERLRKYDLSATELDHLKRYISRAADRELYKANPRYLAQILGWDQPRALDILTLAAAENLMHIEWDTFCPACSGGLQHTHTLGEIRSHQSCDCGWEGEIVLDQAVAVQTSLDESVRHLRPAKDDPQFRQDVDSRLGRLMALSLVNRRLFRDVLGEQTLPGNQSLGVQHLAVFFSDLKGSTALYQRLGDASAYQLVREHFNVLFKAVERAGGSAVKTIGDGVMGTFFDNASAIRGVTESVKGLEDLNRQAGLHGDARLRLKAGLHAGPCIVVTLNHRLDYFGSTVNIASRLSNLAEGDDLILSQDVLNEPAALEQAQMLGKIQEVDTVLRGVQQMVQVRRLAY